MAPRIICKARTPRGAGNWSQCNRNKGHEGEHVDTKNMPAARWTDPEE